MKKASKPAAEQTKKKGRPKDDDDEDEPEDDDSDGGDEKDDDEDEEDDEEEDSDEDSDDEDSDDDDEEEEDSDDDEDDDDEDSEPEEGTAVSFDVDKQEEGGGLWSGRGKVIVAKCVMTDYKGKQAVKSPAIYFKIQPCDPKTGRKTDEEPIEQFWSAGNRKRIVAAKDGSKFINRPGVSQEGLNKSTNAGDLLRSAVECGLVLSKMKGDIRNLAGLDCDWHRKPQPKREGLEGESDSSRPKTTLVISKIHAMPWDKGASKSKKITADDDEEEEAPAPKKGKVKKSGELTASQKIDTEAEEAIMALLKETPKLLLSKVSKLLYALPAVKKSKNRDEILERTADTDWLESDGRPFNFDGKVITAAYKRSK